MGWLESSGCLSTSPGALQIESAAPGRERGAPTPGYHLTPKEPRQSLSVECGPMVLRPALLPVSLDSAGAPHPASGDAGSVASSRVSWLLALEVPQKGRAPADRHGAAGAHPRDEQR